MFFINNITIYIFILFVISTLLVKIPLKYLKSGWLPIFLLIFFTFISNLFFQKGKILYTIGPVSITDDGLSTALIRTIRVFLMIAGAKILIAKIQIDEFVSVFENFLKPLERFKIPVVDFFQTMGLVMKSFPCLKKQFLEDYRNKIAENNICGFWNHSMFISKFLFTLMAKSLQHPEKFFNNDKEIK